ncbi:ATP-binding cassette domain-containing protein [Ornithinibacter aureus]|uniref:ATP-binding cassette domain-containing protein n=1 Tax=Ornithinibacter aureus TaxID=622664 RepID=A0ABP8JJ39_9MICO|nr:ABC transporter ATP-binding protein [Ornithinibacter aureus]KAF0833769.1 ABC-type multidrug transport system fused ATPase/permease subunit [Ornithinibacter aureus]
MSTATMTAREPVAQPAPPTRAASRQVTLARLRGWATGVALTASAIGALGRTLGTVVAGLLAANPSTRLVGLLALCVVGAAVLDTAGRTLWASVVDRAEGRMREDLVDAALHQPLSALGEQAVGEVLDRVDDDTHAVGSMLRRQVWDALRTVFSAVPMWIVAGLTWWPAWILFPVAGAAAFAIIRRLLPAIAERTVIEEAAWTDHAAALEEGVSARDDLRTSLGQAHVVQRLSALSATVHRRFDELLALQARATRRTGILLYSLLAATSIAGVALVISDDLSVARLVTLFLVTSTFVGQIDQMARHLPELQTGIGAITRLRQLLESPPEPEGGRPVPAGSVGVEFRDLRFSYAEGDFALDGVSLDIPAGRTCALVGRSGSGKSTLAALLSRATDPPRGAVFLGGIDVCDLDLHALRSAVGVVTQRTDILAGTLAENIALFADVPTSTVRAAVTELGLDDWVDGLPDGLETTLGPGGTPLSAGEEQLVAFARLLVRDVAVVVLDEATARMDPVTESLVVMASDRLLTGRTGILVAHRLTTTARADLVAVLDRGRVVQQGPRAVLAATYGPFRQLLDAGAEPAPEATLAPGAAPRHPADDLAAEATVGGARRTGPPPETPDPGHGPSLARGVVTALLVRPRWGIWPAMLFFISALGGAFGAATGLVWGLVVEHLADGAGWDTRTVVLLALATVFIVASPLLLTAAIRRYPRWWVEVLLRVRMSILIGQTRQHRLESTPAGEVVARAMDADRYALYADRWVDFLNGLAVVAVTAILGGSALAGGVLLGVLVGSALASAVGRPIAGRSATESSAARATFGRSLVSVLESARTIKLASATPAARSHLRRVDSGRVDAAVFEHRVQAILDGVPVIMVQIGVVAAWAAFASGRWSLATAILVSGAVNGFDWFGRVAGAVVTEAPGTRSWQKATSALAGGVDLVALPPGIDLVEGTAPAAPTPQHVPLRELELRDVGAIHDDGTRGVEGVDLTVHAGELVLLLGQVGSGKSSLLRALAGLIHHTGSITWNGVEVDDAQVFLRPGQVSYVSQVPRVLSGSFADNVVLGHGRALDRAIADARLREDVEDAGGHDALVGHRGVRLSGGQVQRLALARALATEAEVLLADDVSSALDATTEIDLWSALRARGTTVIGATSKRAALGRADRVVVLVDGRVAEVGPWSALEQRWAHLAG